MKTIGRHCPKIYFSGA